MERPFLSPFNARLNRSQSLWCDGDNHPPLPAALLLAFNRRRTWRGGLKVAGEQITCAFRSKRRWTDRRFHGARGGRGGEECRDGGETGMWRRESERLCNAIHAKGDECWRGPPCRGVKFRCRRLFTGGLGPTRSRFFCVPHITPAAPAVNVCHT